MRKNEISVCCKAGAKPIYSCGIFIDYMCLNCFKPCKIVEKPFSFDPYILAYVIAVLWLAFLILLAVEGLAKLSF